MHVCPACATENPERARFCLNCGASLGVAGAGREVRKNVSVLFADVTGSTALAEQLDPESVRRLLAGYFATARTVVERHGGTVEKFIGDAVMAVFGIPSAHEDDALRAVRAAAELQKELGALDGPGASGARIQVRIGVNSGEVVAGTGEGTLVTGDPVNTAARLQQTAAPGDIILGTATLQLVRDAVIVERLGPLALKGKAEPVQAFRLVSIRPGAEAHARRVDAQMVGRERELAALRSAFERAAFDRIPQLFTVLGVAGVGKSRLMREFLAGVGDECTVLRGRCLPYGEGITYWPIVEIIRSGGALLDSDTSEEAREKIDRLFEQQLDWKTVARSLAQLLGLDTGTTPQEELFWAVRKYLEAEAADRPIVVVIEDIHWAEHPLLDLLEHVADLSRDVPLLMLCSARPELVEDRPTWAGGKLNATAILVESLGPDAAERLIDQLLPGAQLGQGARARIHEAAEGNPLFVEEVLGMLIDDGVLRQEDGTWVTSRDLDRVAIPPTIQSLLAARLDRLSPGERGVAARAAVIGRRFETSAVVALSPEADRASVPRHLLSLVRKELVRPEASSAADEAFRFRHILIRDAAYESLTKAERSELHERLAEWAKATAGDRIGELDEIVGYHFEQAYRYRAELGLAVSQEEGLAVLAAGHLLSAAVRSIARSDVRATVNLLSRATELLPADDPRRHRGLIDLAEALRAIGEQGRGEQILRDLVRQARASGDARLEAHAIVVHWGLVIDSIDDPGDAERDARAALKVFEAVGDDLGLARAWRLVGDVHWVAGAGAAAEAAVMRSLEHARRAGNGRDEAEAYLDLSAILTTGPARVDDAIRRCEEILQHSDGNRAVEAWMTHTLAHMHARLGEFGAARDLYARCMQILEETGQTTRQAFLSELVADVELLAGDPTAAVSVLQAGLDTLARAGESSPMLSAFLSNALVAAGQIEEAEQRAEQALTGSGWQRAIGLGSLARVRAAEGRHPEARALAGEAVEHFGRTDFLTFHAGAQLALADVLRASSRWAEAIDAAERALDLHQQKGSIVGVAEATRVVADLRAASVAAR